MSFFFDVIAATVVQLVGCPLHFAIQPLTNQAINSLFVIYGVPCKSSNTKSQSVFFASGGGRSGLVVLKVLTLQQKKMDI
jgi:hypothetical protein